jgi:NTP pyrophosphatase (non-canonical NTP hydrolase)
VDLAAFQDLMARTYGARDAERGKPATLAWLAEETGELARAVRKGSADEQLHELGDVLAWLASGRQSTWSLARRRRGSLRGRMPGVRIDPL